MYCLSTLLFVILEIADPCLSNPCFNSGTCQNLGNNYQCTCPIGFTGPRCETADPCMSNPCLNSGTCQNIGNNVYQCTCAQGFTGTRCQSMHDFCIICILYMSIVVVLVLSFFFDIKLTKWNFKHQLRGLPVMFTQLQEILIQLWLYLQSCMWQLGKEVVSSSIDWLAFSYFLLLILIVFT